MQSALNAGTVIVSEIAYSRRNIIDIFLSYFLIAEAYITVREARFGETTEVKSEWARSCV